MNRPEFARFVRQGVTLLWFALLVGCATQKTPEPETGTPEERLARLEKASRNAPDNHELRLRFLNARMQIVGQFLGQAEEARRTGDYDTAAGLYQRALRIDPDSPQGRGGLLEIEQERRIAALLADANAALLANNLDLAEQKIAQILRDDPKNGEALELRRIIDDRSGHNSTLPPALRAAFQKPVSLEFRDTALKQVLEALSQHVGLNFVLDKDVPPDTTVTVFLRRVSVGDALNVMLGTNRLKKRILNDSTILIYPDTADKVSDNQDLVVKNFFLANAEAKQVMNMLKTMLKAKTVFADDKLNLLIMRDTPDMIRLAERMVSIHDVAEPEVMLDLEVIEVKRSRLTNLGILFPDQLTLFPIPSVGTQLTLRDLRHLNSATVGASISNAGINLQDILNNSDILANPRIRTHNREKALIRIGDRVPVITTTATSTGFVAENVQYIDVGLKLEVEPTIFPTDEVAIKLALEVSSVTKELVSSSGTHTYQIGTRNAATVLRLKNGETQILGGLINDQDIRAANRFPGLGELPVLGRLFSSNKDTKDKTELLLSITPRLVRGLTPPTRIPGEFWSGTENDPRLNTLALARQAPEEAPPAMPPAKPGAKPAKSTGAAPASPSPAAAGPAAPTSPAPASIQSVVASGTALPAFRWQGPATVKSGSRIRVSLDLATLDPVNGLPLQITYDKTVFDVVSAEPGTFLAQNNATVETRKRIEAAEGQVFITQQREGNGAIGSGRVLELELRALRPATDSLIEARAVESGGAATGEKPTPTPGNLPQPSVIGITVTE